MKKGKIFKCLMAAIIISSMTLGLSGIAYASSAEEAPAASEDYNRPKKFHLEQMLEKGDSSGLTDILADIYQEDGKMHVIFNNKSNSLVIERRAEREEAQASDLIVDGNYNLPPLEEGEKYFVVLIDSGTEKIEKFQYLDATEDGKFECYLDEPWYSSRLDLHIYKQNANEKGDFVIRKENFIGRTKVLTAHEANYTRQDKKQLNPLDKDGNPLSDSDVATAKKIEPLVEDKTFIMSRLTPNYYTIEGMKSPRVKGHDQIAKIIIPDDKKNLMKKDQIIVPGNNTHYSYINENDDDDDGGLSKKGEATVKAKELHSEESERYESKIWFNFYLPAGIDEFTFQVYGKNISDNKEDILYQVKVNLNKN